MDNGDRFIEMYEKLTQILAQVEIMTHSHECGMTTRDLLLDRLDDLHLAIESTIDETKSYIWDYINDSHGTD